MKTLSAEIVRQRFHYDPAIGIFTWKIKFKKMNVGDRAGVLDSYGYRVITIGCSLYKAHRLAWLYVYGKMPTGMLDHKNGIKDDNRIENLREADNSQSQANRGKHKNNKSGLKGVFWYARIKRWRATIGKNRTYLGDFNTAQEAHAAYCAAATELYGEFARTA